jgi:hypothetical protein
MKYILIIITILLSTQACIKKHELPKTIRIVGFIYNSNDSTPFKNTKFKIFKSNGKYKEPNEEFFYTDSIGAFDYSTTTMSSSNGLFWPSYFEGAAYLGPPMLGNSEKWEYNEVTNTHTSYFDTLYTTPYH